MVAPGQTLKTFATKPGLPDSRIATAEFPNSLPSSVDLIHLEEFPHHAYAKVGEPFSMSFSVECRQNIVWNILGSTGELYRVFQGVDKKQYVPWVAMDQDGNLSGTPRMSDTYVMYVEASWMTGSIKSPDSWTADVRPLIVTVVDSTDTIPVTGVGTQNVYRLQNAGRAKTTKVSVGEGVTAGAFRTPVFDLRGRRYPANPNRRTEAKGLFVIPDAKGGK